MGVRSLKKHKERIFRKVALHFDQNSELLTTNNDKSLALKQHKHLIEHAIQNYNGPVAMADKHDALLMYMSRPYKNVIFGNLAIAATW